MRLSLQLSLMNISVFKLISFCFVSVKLFVLYPDALHILSFHKQPAVGGYFNTLYNHTSIHGQIVSFSKTLGGQKFSGKEQIMKLNFREL